MNCIIGCVCTLTRAIPVCAYTQKARSYMVVTICTIDTTLKTKYIVYSKQCTDTDKRVLRYTQCTVFF